jgi:hypothetical protein
MNTAQFKGRELVSKNEPSEPKQVSQFLGSELRAGFNYGYRWLHNDKCC